MSDYGQNNDPRLIVWGGLPSQRLEEIVMGKVTICVVLEGDDNDVVERVTVLLHALRAELEKVETART